MRSLLPLLALLVLVAPARAQRHLWPTTRWEVICVIGPVFDTECGDLAPDLAAADPGLTFLLEAYSEWLEKEGFRSPADLVPDIRYDNGSYLAFLLDDANLGEYGWDCMEGGVPDCLLLDADLYRGRDGTGSPQPLEALFHHVLEAYEWPQSEANAWVWEGGTGGSLLAFVLSTEGFDFEWGIPGRHYDHPLDDPPPHQAIGTGHFWATLGALEHGNPSATLMAEFFDTAAMDDPLAELDEFLAPYGHLYAVFPVFIAAIAKAPRFFSVVTPIDVVLPAGREEERVETEGRVRRVAADAYRVRVTAPPEHDAEVEIKEPTRAADLHLIVEGDVYNGANRFTATIPKGETREFFVRLANVAEVAAQTTDDRRYTLEVTLRPVEPAYAVLRQDRPAELEPGSYSFGRLVVEGTPLDGEPEKLALHFEVRDADTDEAKRRVYQVALDHQVIFNAEERTLAELIRRYDPEEPAVGVYRFAIPVEEITTVPDHDFGDLVLVAIIEHKPDPDGSSTQKTYEEIALVYPCGSYFGVTGDATVDDERENALAFLWNVPHDDGRYSFSLDNAAFSLPRGYLFNAGLDDAAAPPVSATGDFPLAYASFQPMRGGSPGTLFEHHQATWPSPDPPVLTVTHFTPNWIEGDIAGTLVAWDKEHRRPVGRVRVLASFQQAHGSRPFACGGDAAIAEVLDSPVGAGVNDLLEGSPALQERLRNVLNRRRGSGQ